MSYLKLDKTNIVYVQNENPATLIISEVVDSSCGPIKPTLIKNINELEINFGTSYPNHEYHKELLSKGSYLLLWRPIQEEIGKPELKDEGAYGWFDRLPIPGKEWSKYYVVEEKKTYVWCVDQYIPEDLIPTEEYSSSTDNRDTLRLIEKGVWPKFTHCHPKYTGDYTGIEKEKWEELKDSLINSIGSYGVDNEDYTIGFIMDFRNVDIDKIDRDNHYIVFPMARTGKSDYNRLEICFKSNPPLGSDIIKGNYYKEVKFNSKEELVNGIVETLRTDPDPNLNIVGAGYVVEPIIEGEVYRIFSSDLLQDQHFYNVPGFILETDFETTQNILSVISEERRRMEFYSKTIGPGDENIKVEIEKLNKKYTERYRIVISRYDYSEIFEGPLYLEQDPDTLEFTSLEKMINEGSKLVEVRVYNEGRDRNNEKDGLGEGTYYLKRSVKEIYDPDSYWRALEGIRDTGICEDFLLIPKIESYERIGASSDISWIKEYELLLDYANEKNCQVLISNHPHTFGCDRLEMVDEWPEKPEEGVMYGVATYKTIIESVKMKNEETGEIETVEEEKTVIDYVDYIDWTGKHYNSDDKKVNFVYEILETFNSNRIYDTNHIFNYTEDKQNRLVYFYRDMTIYGQSRPAYYVLLDGILTGTYTEEIDTILYQSPVSPYDEDERKGINLWDKKSNFLSCNDHIFYYRQLFNHTNKDWDYEFSVLTRFCMDKVTNTVSRELPFCLGASTSGEIITGINNIISYLKQTYPIIYSLEISQIIENANSLDVYLDLGIKEILDHDVNLTLTLNFYN